ncbi:type III toxin-antitoxin system TenpIN family toxin [Anaerovibrio sp.]|uniref:type III toxin-antitoxin system TenpIN family toxin n=1 Tax=Anaerovibrio sp. TaxID=1872532 RepID=UPI00388EA9FE
MIKFVFLSQTFYTNYPKVIFPEIAQKSDRPYVYVAALINGVQYAVPMRSNINHHHVLWTDKENHCGLDFSKAVVIENDSFIDKARKPYIRPNEFKALIGKEYVINKKMSSFINKYKKAKQKQHIKANQDLCNYSTLKYFEKYL